MPGVGETITWARALLALGPDDDLDATLGVALKVREDIERVRERAVLAWCLSAVAAGCRTLAAALRALRRARRGRGAAGRAPRAGRGRRRLARGGVLRAARDAVLRACRPRAVRARLRGGVRRRRAAGAQDPLEALGEIARAALPRVGVPAGAAEPVAVELDAVPAAWSDEELLREKDFADYTDAERAAARRCSRGWRAAAPARAEPAHAARAPARPRPRPARDDARVAAPRRRAARAPLARADAAPAPARAGPRRLRLDGAVRADAAAVRAGVASPRARAGRGVRVRHPADAAHARARRPRPRPRARRAPPSASPTGRGGTRIGASLATLNREHGRRIGRGAFVVLLSDGWDRGDPDELARRAGAAAPHRAPARLAQPARRRSRATSRSRAGCGRRCRTSTGCCRGIRIASLEQLADLMEDAHG